MKPHDRRDFGSLPRAVCIKKENINIWARGSSVHV